MENDDSNRPGPWTRLETIMTETIAAVERAVATHRALAALDGEVSEEWNQWRQRGYTGIECVALSCLRQRQMAARMLHQADELGLTAEDRRYLVEDMPNILLPAEVDDVEELTASGEAMTSLFGPHYLAVVELVHALHSLPEDALLRVDATGTDDEGDDCRQTLIDEVVQTLAPAEFDYAQRAAEAAYVSAAWRCGADPRTPEDFSDHTLTVATVAQISCLATALKHHLDASQESTLLSPWWKLLAN